MSICLDFKSVHPHTSAELVLRAKSGTISVIYGASGRGKSTLLSQIWGSRPIAENGHVILTINNQSCDLTRIKPAHLAQIRGQTMSYVEQNPAVLKRDYLYNWFNLKDPRLLEGLVAFDLPPDLCERRASDVSGGELQRFILLRAVLSKAPIILLDEPFTGLDRERTERVATFILAEAKRGRLVVLTAHEQCNYADESLLLT